MSTYYYGTPGHLVNVEARLGNLGRPVYRGITGTGRPHLNVGALELRWETTGGIVWYRLHGNEVHWCWQPVERGNYA